MSIEQHPDGPWADLGGLACFKFRILRRLLAFILGHSNEPLPWLRPLWITFSFAIQFSNF